MDARVVELLAQNAGGFCSTGPSTEHRPPRWQKSQAQVAAIILGHVRRQRRTVISVLGRLILLVHALLPRLADWVVLTSQRRIRNFYE